jgi:hypothetical protein
MNFSPSHPRGSIPVAAIISGMENLALLEITKYNTLFHTNMEYEDGQLRIGTVLSAFFDTQLSKIINHISQLMQLLSLQKVCYLFLVGGFADSQLLQERIETTFGEKVCIVIPRRPGAAVMNGAVLYGLNPDVVSKRVMPTSIGVLME